MLFGVKFHVGWGAFQRIFMLLKVSFDVARSDFGGEKSCSQWAFSRVSVYVTSRVVVEAGAWVFLGTGDMPFQEGRLV